MPSGVPPLSVAERAQCCGEIRRPDPSGTYSEFSMNMSCLRPVSSSNDHFMVPICWIVIDGPLPKGVTPDARVNGRSVAGTKSSRNGDMHAEAIESMPMR